MNVFYASASSANNDSLPHSRIWDINFLDTFKNMGVKVLFPSYDVSEQYSDTYKYFLNRDEESLHRTRKYYNQILVDDVKKAHKTHGLDLVFTYFSSRHISVETISEIKSLGVPVVNFYCNSIHQFELVEEIAPHFDYFMFPEREALSRYLAVGANPVHIQMAANPDFYKPYDLPRIYDVTFVGQKYLNREDYLAFLYNNAINSHVWGPGWSYSVGQKTTPHDILRSAKRYLFWLFDRKSYLPASHCHGVLSDLDLVRMYSQCRVSLAFSEVLMPDGNIKRHIRLRDFEGPMSGALYFTGYQDELADYYEIGKEIICYDSKEDLLEKVKYYLANRGEAEKIRAAGLKKARGEHTWKQRFLKLFEVMGLSL